MALEIIAEIHPQHGGSMSVAREMIREAKRNGADVAKFQLYDAEALLGPSWRYLELQRDEVAQLRNWCAQEEIEFMASIFDATRLGWCVDLGVERYKIASRTVVEDPDLCREILDLGRETLVSLGLWEGEDKPFGNDPRIRYLYCKASYPALLEDLTDFPRDFPAEGLAGYSDHTLGIEVCLLAIARGANLIEKHMTLDKTQTKDTERAHVCSMTPQELHALSRTARALHRARRTVEDLHSRPPAG